MGHRTRVSISETKGEIGIKTNFALPGFHERVYTNVSNEGLGAILSQGETEKDLPVAQKCEES
jgi:hypothetical protein